MSDANLNEQLWATVLAAAEPLKIDASLQLFLQARISNAVERMHNENRTGPADVATAKASLKTIVEMIKSEALAHGGERLDHKSFHAAQHNLEQRSRITVYSLWPFWPHAVSG